MLSNRPEDERIRQRQICVNWVAQATRTGSRGMNYTVNVIELGGRM